MIFFVDDESSMRATMRARLNQHGFDTRVFASGKAVLQALKSSTPDAIISDLRMPNMDGITLLGKVNERLPMLPFFLLTAYGDVPSAVRAVKAGATDYLLKPPAMDKLVPMLSAALEENQARRRTECVIGNSTFRDAYEQTTLFADKAAPLLITGESGTGKEILAQRAHEKSGRRGKLVCLNMAAITEALFEDALFGHERGAFSGAEESRPGAFRAAHEGTLFLDEIGELPVSLQPKLLRVLSTKTFRPVGSTTEVAVNVRIISATNRDLKASVDQGIFRADLFHRLSVLQVEAPSLRERIDDLEALVDHFVQKFAGTLQDGTRLEVEIRPAALVVLKAHGWPGNVRELESLVERWISSRAKRASLQKVVLTGDEASALLSDRSSPTKNTSELGERRRSEEQEAIVDALKKTGGNRKEAAKLLGISRSSLYNKLSDLEL